MPRRDGATRHHLESNLNRSHALQRPPDALPNQQRWHDRFQVALAVLPILVLAPALVPVMTAAIDRMTGNGAVAAVPWPLLGVLLATAVLLRLGLSALLSRLWFAPIIAHLRRYPHDAAQLDRFVPLWHGRRAAALVRQRVREL